MSNVMFSLRKTTVDALATISSTAGAITSTVNAVSHLAEAGELHAKSYRDETEIELKARRQKSAFIATAKAQHKVTRSMMELEAECKDPAFEEMLRKVQAEWNNPKPTISMRTVAAE